MSAKRALRIAGRALMLVVLVAAGWFFYREIQQYSFGEIRSRIASIPTGRFWLCVGLTALNYMILIGYDLVAVRSLGSKLATKKVVLAAFTGHVTAMNLGPLLGGTPVRIRLYTSWGMSALEVARLLALVVLTFWLGMLALAGVIFLTVPLPTLAGIDLGIVSLQELGAGALLIAGAYVVTTWVKRKPLRIFGRTLPLPAPGTALLQMAIAAADLAVAAAALYVLLPEESRHSFPQFLGVYLLAIVAVTFANVPGGVGVLELAIMSLAAGQVPEGVVAALLAFRVIYYLCPLGIAAGLLVWNELRGARRGGALAFQVEASHEGTEGHG